MTEQDKSNTATSQAAILLRLDKGRRRWRLLAVVAVVCFLFTVFAIGQTRDTGSKMPHIAQITIEGLLTDSLYSQKVLEELRTNPATKAVMVYVDSPGGTMVGGLNMHHSLRRIAADKPVVTVMGTVAASAGYMVSAAGDHIVASPGSITGSIGVMMPLVDATELARKIGIRSEEVVSGAYKTSTSPLKERSADERAYLKDTVMEMQGVFLDLIKDRRPLSDDALEKIADGRILTGVTAHSLGLVDSLGNRHTAFAWLNTEKGLSADLPLRDVSIHEPEGFFEAMIHGAQTVLFSKQFGHGIMAIMD